MSVYANTNYMQRNLRKLYSCKPLQWYVVILKHGEDNDTNVPLHQRFGNGDKMVVVYVLTLLHRTLVRT